MYICQLDDSNSNLYHDGSQADLMGSDGEVFMKLPCFYYHAEETSADIWNIGFSSYRVADDWKEWDGKDFIGTYKGRVRDRVLHSWSGTMISTGLSQTEFKRYAQANGSGFSLVKFKHHSMMAFLFYAYYGNTNSQAVCGRGASSFSTGKKDDIGMADTVSGGNGDSGAINFWGLEGWWGGYYEFVDNVDTYNYAWSITEDDGSVRDVEADGLYASYITRILIGENLDLVPVGTYGNASRGFCDYYYSSSSSSNILVRSCYDNGDMCGVAYTDTHDTNLFSNPYYGTRLAYRGDYEEIESSVEFKALS